MINALWLLTGGFVFLAGFLTGFNNKRPARRKIDHAKKSDVICCGDYKEFLEFNGE